MIVHDYLMPKMISHEARAVIMKTLTKQRNKLRHFYFLLEAEKCQQNCSTKYFLNGLHKTNYFCKGCHPKGGDLKFTYIETHISI